MRAYVILTASLLLILASHTPVAADGIELRLLAPGPKAVINANSLTVVFEVTGAKVVPAAGPAKKAGMRPALNRPGEGHIQLMLDLQPVVTWGENKPYTFTDVPAGDHLLTVEFVNNDHSSLSPPVLVQQLVQVHAGDTASQLMLPNTGPGMYTVLSSVGKQLGITRWHLGLLAAIELLSLGLFLRRVPIIIARIRPRK